MNSSLLQLLEKRRTYYKLGRRPVLSDVELQRLVEGAILHVPSAFNSQSTRMVLLLGEQHEYFWNTVKKILQEITPADAFERTRAKIDGAFLAGEGTILFFEDKKVVEGLQQRFPLYKDSFPIYAEHTSAMHQLAVWMLLEEAGYGASLQHYNPLVDEAVIEKWNISPDWKLVAQMPFGSPEEEPGEKTFNPIAERVKVFK